MYFKNIETKLATNKDVQTIKDFINKMYGYEYEKRENSKIAECIDNKTEVYILAYKNNNCIGFSGASLNNEDYKDIISPFVAVIDYIFTEKQFRNITTSFSLISMLLKELKKNGVKQAIMQVQTYNKQRFFHYALSDKNIIKSKTLNNYGITYEDQILLIDDINKVANISLRELMTKAYNYKN